MSAAAIVLGAFGFIGRHVCREFDQRGIAVVGIGHGNWREQEWRQWGLSAWRCSDITVDAIEGSIPSGDPIAIVHCAGSGAVSMAYADPQRDFDRSVSTTAAALEVLRRRGDPACRFVSASSAAVYGDQGDADASETATKAPISPYGYHKVMSEALCDSYSRFFSVPTTVVRLFSVYGEGLRKQLLWDALIKFSNGDATFFGTGHELRDWIHVTDAAALLCTAAEERQPGAEIYNGGHEHATTRRVLTELAAAAGISLVPKFSGETHAGNPRRLTANNHHARRQLPWAPRVGLAPGLARYAEWFASVSS